LADDFGLREGNCSWEADGSQKPAMEGLQGHGGGPNQRYPVPYRHGLVAPVSQGFDHFVAAGSKFAHRPGPEGGAKCARPTSVPLPTGSGENGPEGTQRPETSVPPFLLPVLSMKLHNLPVPMRWAPDSARHPPFSSQSFFLFGVFYSYRAVSFASTRTN